MYKVKSRLKHDGNVYEIGDTVDLGENIALRLVKNGVLEGKGKDKEVVEKSEVIKEPKEVEKPKDKPVKVKGKGKGKKK